MRHLTSFALAVLFVGSLVSAPSAAPQAGGRITPIAPPPAPAAPAAPQAPSAPPAPPVAPAASGARPPAIALKLDVVLSRYQGEKKVSSAPYTLFTSYGGGGGNGCSLQSGSNVPIPASAAADAEKAQRYTYQRVGVTVSCTIWEAAEGRFRLSVNVDESSLADTAPGAFGAPVIRSNELRATVILKDGQSQLFSLSTDKVTGETLRAEVTLTTLK